MTKTFAYQMAKVFPICKVVLVISGFDITEEIDSAGKKSNVPFS